MNLRDLQNILTICDAKSLSRAAMRLGVSQPALSRTVRQLEEEIGMALFRRTGRGVEPTEAGLILCEHAAQVMRELCSAQERLDALRSVHRGEVTMLIPHYVSKTLVPPVIKRFSSEFPLASLHVFEEVAAEIPQRLQDGTADLGIFYPPQGAIRLKAETVAYEKMYLVGLPHMFEASCGTIAFGEVANKPLILSSRRTPYRRLVEEFAASIGKHLRVVRELEVSYTQLAFVLEGEGATILPLSHCHEEIASGLVAGRVIEKPEMRRQILMAYGSRASGQLVKAAARMFREVIQDHGATCGWLAPDHEAAVAGN